MMRRIGTALAVIVLAVIGGSIPAFADPAPPPESSPGWSANSNGDAATLHGVQANQNYSSSNGTRIYTLAGPWTQAVYAVTCDRTGDGGFAGPPVAEGPGVDEYSGGESGVACPIVPCAGGGTSGGDLFTYSVWTRPIGADGLATADFTFAGEQCVSAAEAARGGRPVITIDMVMDAAEALAPTPTFTMEPAAGSFVNIPNNYATTAQTVTVPVTVLGAPIPVEFTPTATTWAFGDSTTGTGVGIAGATVGQSGAVEHAYRHSGDYTITVATTYRARVRFPNGQVTTIDTPIVRTSAPQTLHVGEIQSIITDIG